MTREDLVIKDTIQELSKRKEDSKIERLAKSGKDKRDELTDNIPDSKNPRFDITTCNFNYPLFLVSCIILHSPPLIV